MVKDGVLTQKSHFGYILQLTVCAVHAMEASNINIFPRFLSSSEINFQNEPVLFEINGLNQTNKQTNPSVL